MIFRFPLFQSTRAVSVRSGRGILRPAGEIGARSRPDLLPEWSFTTSARPAHHGAAEPLPCPRVTPPPGRPGAEQECRTAAAPCATKLSLKGLLLRAMTAAATPASEGRGADHGRPAIGARSARMNNTPIRWRFLVIQEHHESFDRPLRGRCPDGLFVRPRGLRCRRREPESARPVSGNLSAVKRVSGLRGATCCWAAGGMRRIRW